jgi:uncharacterized membrane protein YoaK (UPF0700 family)
MACLYGIYILYAVWLLQRRPGAPCGCSSGEHAVNVWVPVRAFALFNASVLAAIAADRLYPTPRLYEYVLSVIAAIALAAILWSLPDAMAEPSARLEPRGV